MNSGNQVTLIGRPKLVRASDGNKGRPICNFQLDCNTGTAKRPHTSTFDCVVMGDLAVLAEEYLRVEGRPDLTPRPAGMIVVGKFKEHTVTNKYGEKRHVAEVHVEDFGASHKLPLAEPEDPERPY